MRTSSLPGMIIRLESNCIQDPPPSVTSQCWRRHDPAPDPGLESRGIWRNMAQHSDIVTSPASYPLTKDENRFLYPWQRAVISWITAVMLIAIQPITIFPLLARAELRDSSHCVTSWALYAALVTCKPLTERQSWGETVHRVTPLHSDNWPQCIGALRFKTWREKIALASCLLPAPRLLLNSYIYGRK